MNSLREYVDAVVATLKAGLPGKVVVEVFDRRKTDKITTPGVYVEFEPVGEGDDRGEEEFPLSCVVTAYCVLSTETASVEIEVAEMAICVMRLVRGSRFGLNSQVGNPEGLESGEAFLDDPKSSISTRYVGWSQVLQLGDSVWAAEGVVPSEVYINTAPDLGVDHQDKYQQVV